MKAVKTIAALLFLTALAIVLVQPVLGADDDAPPPSRGSAAGETTPEDDHEVDPGDEDENESAEDVALTSTFPKRCLQRTDAAPTGLVAARRGSTVSVGMPSEPPSARFGVSGDAAWSPSGRYLAEKGGELFDTGGRPLGSIFFQPVKWQWSPVADCVVALTDNGNLTFGIPGTERLGIQLLDVPVADFDVSPNGKRLAFVVEGGGLWTAKLRSGKVLQVTAGHASLAGWFSNRIVLYSKSPGSGKLRYGKGAEGRVVKGASAGTSLSSCEGRTLLTGVPSAGTDPLSEVFVRNGRLRGRALPGASGPYDGFSGAACSPDGGFVIASANVGEGEKGPLVLLQSDGTFVSEVMRGRTANPAWTSDGVLFVKFGAGDRGRLWFIPPNGAPAPTDYTVGAPNQYDWHSR